MRKIKLWFPIFLVVALFAFSLTAQESTDKLDANKESAPTEITWYELDTAIIMAKEQNKHVFIDFKTAWCGYCKKMDREVFSDPEIITLLNGDFIPAKVDGDSQNKLDIDGFQITEKDLARHEFGVRGYPTFWWLTPDGKKLLSLNGYRPKSTMKEALTYIKDYKYDTTKTAPSEEGQNK